jgi:transposase
MHIQGQSRDQGTLFPERLDELIDADNPVRVIDAFVDALDLSVLRFARMQVQATGRPPYHPGDLLKLYLYGYMHRVRSSRRLERECRCNVEVLWLLNRLTPDFKTIANFRVDNRVALTRVCRAFVQFCRGQALFGGEQIAIDGSKFLADNNRGKVQRKTELAKQLQQVDKQIGQWLDTLDDHDNDDEPPAGGDTQAALAALEAERATLTARIEAMDAAGLSAQPETDPEARVMKRGRIGYNVQSTVDSKHRLISDVDVVQDGNDLQQLYRMARRSQRLLNSPRLAVLADAGYSNGRLLKRCQAHGLTPWVPVQRAINNQGTGRSYDKTAFAYNAADDSYTCPAGERLPKKTKATKDRLYLYTTDACGSCDLKMHCTATPQRWVTRHFDEAVLNEVAARTAANPMMMRRRSGMVEHPFGTLKRRMDGGRFLLRGLQKVKAEMALAVTAYNLTRAINVLGVRQLCQALTA